MQCEAVTIEKTPKPASRASKGFNNLFFRNPAAGTTADAIVERWDRGEINRQQANNLLILEFGQRGDVDAFSTLYQLNQKHFLNIIKRRLNGYAQQISPADVLQEVFVLIYRYPNKFRHEHDRSFYNWSYSIIINTIRRKIKNLGLKMVDLDAIADTHEDRGAVGPLRRLILSEEIENLKRLYSIVLVLYLNAFRFRLNQREKDALHLVEVKQLPYREAAGRLGLKYDNFKMIICRARKKIFEGIEAMIDRAA